VKTRCADSTKPILKAVHYDMLVTSIGLVYLWSLNTLLRTSISRW